MATPSSWGRMLIPSSWDRTLTTLLFLRQVMQKQPLKTLLSII